MSNIEGFAPLENRRIARLHVYPPNNTKRPGIENADTAEYCAGKIVVQEIFDPITQQRYEEGVPSCLFDEIYRVGEMYEKPFHNGDPNTMKYSRGFVFYKTLQGVLAWDYKYVPPDFTGEWTTYHENGNIASQMPFVNGKKHGTEQLWGPRGNITRWVTWENNSQIHPPCIDSCGNNFMDIWEIYTSDYDSLNEYNIKPKDFT